MALDAEGALEDDLESRLPLAMEALELGRLALSGLVKWEDVEAAARSPPYLLDMYLADMMLRPPTSVTYCACIL